MCPSLLNFWDLLRQGGHLGGEAARATPLTGGVSSEIYLIEDGEKRLVVKRALPQLKVKDEWIADVRRNDAEQAYFRHVGSIVPGVVPQVYFANSELGYFGMEFFGEEFTNWKHLLLAGACRVEDAELAGDILGRIHHRTYSNKALQARFDNTESFHQLRVEPYLLTTGARHPRLKDAFIAEAHRIKATREVLVHGDFSPKNILVSRGRLVLLDAEVAWYGDAAFDVAFVLTHLFLKALHHSPNELGIDRMIAALWLSYLQSRPECHARNLEQRVIPLLLMLLLARVDGKSPVEYLSLERREFIKTFVHTYLPSPPRELAILSEIWFAQISQAAVGQQGL
jgi:aminoglycoside phosphotransferase (APT) family kinase protein